MVPRFLLVKEEVENPILRLPSQKISELDIIARDEVVTNALAYKTPRKKIVRSLINYHLLFQN